MGDEFPAVSPTGGVAPASAAADPTPRTPIEPQREARPVRHGARISSLDFLRGLAVMGIVFANIVAFGQPLNAYFYPGGWIGESGDPEGWWWIAQFVLIDGKMRGLFTLLFGAGLYLFMERAWARGQSRWLQIWRLVLLLAFGLAHFYFIWEGDILAMYALIGFGVTACLRWDRTRQLRIAMLGYALGALLLGAMQSLPILIEAQVFGDSPEMAEARDQMLDGRDRALADDRASVQLVQAGDYGAVVGKRLTDQLWMPFTNTLFFGFETFPLMLLGAALYRFGFFTGEIDRSKMRRWGWIALGAGAAASLAIALFVRSMEFGYFTTFAALVGWSMVPRLAMTLGLAALLIDLCSTPGGRLRKRVEAAGRAAFTNYLGTSILMLFVMQGWALGLFAQLNRPQLYLVALATCFIMLAWSKPWLDRFRYGPLEWLWRCLTYRKLFAIRREGSR